MERIFILVAGIVLLLQTVIVKPEKQQAEGGIPHNKPLNEPEEDRDMIYHSLPDNLHHNLQPEMVVLHQTPMNEPEEDRDMIHHGDSNILQQELQAEREQETVLIEPAEGYNDAAITGHEHHVKMVLPYEPLNEPEEDRDTMYHSLPDDLYHNLQTEMVILHETPMNEPEEDRDMIHHGI
ncbi:uncharacterized protein si:ch211-217g15.3 [Stegostoma tigrinum]|uniref:uncharacterized protein si:ch211-217g15.3 n=1 Tax=Stegostoma tigrinum TaxID=3053191 RepID=UPI00202B6495|nr:uncharacterized protein si:ch211-217g15.3 [Stegostoma tigrinum]